MGSFTKTLAAALMVLLGPNLAVARQPGDAPLGSGDRLIVAHASRAVSLDEICHSIRRTLESKGAPESAVPSVGQIHPAVPVMITTDDPGLQVLRMDADVIPGSVRVRLWTGGQPAIHPFDVTVLGASNLLQWLNGQKGFVATPVSVISAADSKPSEKNNFAKPPAPKPQALVFPGRTATLLLRAPGMEVRTPVMPLDRGVSGQWVRVRNLSTGQILNAEVVGPGSLAMEF